MELRQLTYFVAVVEEGSFTRAAQQVHVAQPGVSAQIRQLERELGQPLLDRSGRAVRLTEAGAAVLPYARAALDAVAGAKAAVDELTGLLRGHVAIGMITSCGPLGLPELIAEFHELYPAVEITLGETNTDELIDGLRTGVLDTAVIGLASTPPAGLAVQIITDEPVVVAIRPDDPLANTGKTNVSSVPLELLRDRALISLPIGTGIRARFEEACAAAGFTPQIAFEASDPFLLVELAERGLGPAILPQSVLTGQNRGLHALTLKDPPLHGQLALAWRAEGPRSPAAHAFLARARTALATLQP